MAAIAGVTLVGPLDWAAPLVTPVRDEGTAIQRVVSHAANAAPLEAAPPPAPAPPIPTESATAAALRADLSARWVKNHRETPLRAGPGDQTTAFNLLPQWSTLKVVEARPGWSLVQYEGDRGTRQPGPGWVKAEDVGPVDPPVLWLAASRTAGLWHAANGSVRALGVRPGTLMEVLTPNPIQGSRVHVRLPGDGRGVPPTQGWIEAADAVRTPAPSPGRLPWSYPAVLGADVRLPVQYRTQLDGSDFAEANCGPTALGMVLEQFGHDVAPVDLRRQVLEAQDMSPDDIWEGSFVWALGDVVERYGLTAVGLYESDGTTLHRWTVDEVRQRVKEGRPVILQVRYRSLPRRETSDYWGDHYIVVTGLLGDQFLYDDPIGGTSEREGPGWDRVIGARELGRAMNASDRPYAYTGFAVAAASRTVADSTIFRGE